VPNKCGLHRHSEAGIAYVVGIVTALRAERRQGQEFSLRHPDRLWVPPSLLFSPYREALSLGVRRPGCEADHSPPSNAEVSLHKDNFTFTLVSCFFVIYFNIIFPSTSVSRKWSRISSVLTMHLKCVVEGNSMFLDSCENSAAWNVFAVHGAVSLKRLAWYRSRSMQGASCCHILVSDSYKEE
jgi:hypothetical protein